MTLEEIKQKIIKEEVENFRKLNLKLNIDEEEFFEQLYGKVIEKTFKLTAKHVFKDIEKTLGEIDSLIATISFTHPFLISKEKIERIRKDYDKLKEKYGLK